MSMQPQGPGWWRASDGRWYPPQPFGTAAVASPKKRGNHGVLIAVLIVVAVVFIGGALGVYFLYRTAANTVSNVVGGGGLNCPSAADISTLVGSEVNGPTDGNMVVASGCYYLPKGPDDVVEVIIVSGSKIIAD